MENPNKIEIEGLKTIHKLCNFGAEHDMEGCSFTEIVERMFSKIKSMQTQVNTLDEMLLNQGDALAEAKAQAVQEGFVLLEKKGLRDTYYWDGCEYVVDHPSEYEMELERGEIVTLEKWQRTKETNVYCANIFSDEDNFELVQFDSLEEAEKAVAANKTMIEAQEQSHD